LKKALILFAIIILWWFVDLILSSMLSSAKSEYVTQRAFKEGFEELKQRWSPQSKKAALKKIDELFGLYSITPKTTEIGNVKGYEFELNNQSSELLSSIFSQPVEIHSFSFVNSDEYTAKVTLEIKF